MADLNVTQVPIDGGLADLAAAAVPAGASGDTAPTGQSRFLAVINGGASPRTVTVATPGTVKGLALEDAVITVAAGDTALLPLNRVFAGADGRASISYDAVTSVSVAVLELGG
ncbi:hypothetical protein [Thermomonospora cellulosilytica]|uniref:Uncharacterized protein n=1 Tax=Thermomonospora cellulosilytica TaxID=1411118 RepID=A0A7W3R6W0_9ACTN|nr:hypothetical protein [Thermomonospora cellulosilytica]MBA9002012.1 hypothetical protein [Thermomonospora cellulosilytica]